MAVRDNGEAGVAFPAAAAGEALALLQSLELGNRDIEVAKYKPAAEVVSRLHAGAAAQGSAFPEA